jgi:hypothetical protein
MALAFRLAEDRDYHYGGTEYRIDDDRIRRQRPGWVARIPGTKRNQAEQYEVLGRAKTVSRRVTVHVLDRLDSPPSIQAAFGHEPLA